MTQIPNVHHVWCNGDPRSPVQGCRWCDRGDGTGLWHSYPYSTVEDMDGLMGKHFPDAVERPGTGMREAEKADHVESLRVPSAGETPQ